MLATPSTSSFTRDCSDIPGEFYTHNDELRDCEWLDNGHNGALSTLKDLNCLHSDLGDACKYTCRLYNGCMEYLLAALPEYTEENDVSIGDECEDQEGSFMSNDGLRECSWLDDPMKKNLNCGTPRTELGIMCPGKCSGYNNCTSDQTDVPTDGPSYFPTFSPTLSPFSVALSEEGNTAIPTYSPSLSPTWGPTTTCHDKDGEFRTHMGTFRQCRWLNRDNIEEKKELNCGITDIGLNCLESCPCTAEMKAHVEKLDSDPTDFPTISPTLPPTLGPVSVAYACQDEEGEFLTDRGTLRQCRWLNRDDIEEKKESNCGITEIGRHCLESCPCGIESGENIKSGEIYSPSLSPTLSPVVVDLDCMDNEGNFTTNSGESQPCSWLDEGNASLKKAFNCQVGQNAALFCQSKCSAINGCDDLHCEDMSGTYVTHTGWRAECSWLSSGGPLLELNCGITEIGKRCQATCAQYNECNTR